MAETGGPVDFDSMDEDELDAFLQKRYDDALARLNANTPSCLDPFIATPTNDLAQHAFDGHGEPLNKVLSVKCKCGGDRFAVIGHHTSNPDLNDVRIFVSPISLRCESCGAENVLFDSDRDGFNASLDSSANIRATGERGPAACACGGNAFRIYTRFEFSGETLEDSIGDFVGNEHNLFSWFSLVGDCAQCGKRTDIAEFETA